MDIAAGFIGGNRARQCGLNALIFQYDIMECVFRIAIQTADLFYRAVSCHGVFHAGVHIHCKGAHGRIASDDIGNDTGTENQRQTGSQQAQSAPTAVSDNSRLTFRIRNQSIIDFSDGVKKNFGFHSIIPSFSRNIRNSFLIRKSSDVTLLSLIPYASAISRIA